MILLLLLKLIQIMLLILITLLRVIPPVLMPGITHVIVHVNFAS